MKIPIRIKTNLLGYSRTLESAIYGVGAKTLEGSMRSGMEYVKEEVLQKFDSTQKKEGSGKLRRSISRVYTVFKGGGEIDSITMGIGDSSKMPPYWRFQEFGTKSFTFIQPFLATFDGINGMRLRSIKKSRVGEIVGDVTQFQVVPNVGLIKPIMVQNPGIKGRGFFLSGKIYIQSNGPEIFGNVIYKFFSNTVKEHTRKSN